jgi:endogenous inhibitor of DNA gyrase (YacG/DUF329 family)
MARRETKPAKAPAPTGPPRLPKPRNAGKCPACGAPVVWLNAGGTITPCDPQRRLVLFSYKADEHGLPLEEEKPLTAFEERTGKCVLGRQAHPMEAKRYKAHGDPGKPFAICLMGHLRSCTRWDRWLSGDAVAPTKLRPE